MISLSNPSPYSYYLITHHQLPIFPYTTDCVLTGTGHGDLEPHTQWTIPHRVHEDAEEVGGQLLQVCDQVSISRAHDVDYSPVSVNFIHI